MTNDPCDAVRNLVANSNLPYSTKKALMAAIDAACAGQGMAKYMDADSRAPMVGNCQGSTRPCYDMIQVS